MTKKAWNQRKGRSSKWITKAKRLAIYIRDGFACSYCGRDLRGAEPREVGLDHLTPQCKGGSHEATNLVTACRSCNSGRQERAWKSYATPGAVERITRRRRRVLNLPLARMILAGTSPWPRG